MEYYDWSDPADLLFFVLPLLLAAALVCAVHVGSRRLGEEPAARRIAVLITVVAALAWMGSTWVMAAQGTFRRWEWRPPAIFFLVVGVVLLAAAIASGSYGRRLAAGLPLWVLVGIQGFRLPLELAMHEMYERGVMPPQMSYSGRNFDIVTGATALAVAALLSTGRAGRRTALVWNVAGLALLLNVVIVAILSTPPIAFFDERPLNVWITYPPFVWLPAVMVLAALAGHLLIFRAVHRTGRS
jgi:hypothetical protein